MPVRTDGTGGDKSVMICVVCVLPPGSGADDILRVRRTPGAAAASQQQLAAIRAEGERAEPGKPCYRLDECSGSAIPEADRAGLILRGNRSIRRDGHTDHLICVASHLP